MPKSLLVIGSGAIGIEFASFYRTMGAEVTVVEILPQMMPVEDAEIAAFAQEAVREAGHEDHAEAKVTKVDKGDEFDYRHIEMKGGKAEKINVDRVISAVGVLGNVENIGLGDARREDRARRDRRRRLRPHQCAGRLRHRRCRRPADAGPQGRA